MKTSPKTSNKNPKLDNDLEDLLHPSCLKDLKTYKSGKKVTLKNTDYLEIPWSSETLDQINAFLRTGQFENLIALLMASPQTIAHPIIFWQVFHLQKLVRRWDKKELAWLESQSELAGGGMDPDEPGLAVETKQAARETLELLLGAWVSRMLPGYTIVRYKVPKRRGPKTKFTPLEVIDLTMAFHTLWDKMKSEKEDFSGWEFVIMKNEKNPAFVTRTTKTVQKLHRIAKIEKGEAVGDILPLPAKTAQSISLHAIEKKGVSKKNYWVSQRKLLYALFAHYEGCSPDSLRGIIERTEADPPEFIKPLLPKKKV